MKKVLGIVGSRRNLGNCEIMVKEISRQIRVPHDLQLLRLPESNLRYCTGCYRCLIKKRGCVLKDDLAGILEAIADADALILAVPTYFLAAHSCLKVFVDRGISFYGMGERLWGKPAVGVGIAGIEGKEGSTLLDIERFFAAIFAEKAHCKILYGALPGEVMLNEENKRIAGEMAAALFGAPPEKSGMRCPLCGGETFRFLEGSNIRCMLCSASGRLVAKEGQLVLEIERGEHEILAGEAEALQHRDWLCGMVERFKEQKGILKEVAKGYADEGSWIRPAEGRGWRMPE